MNTRARDLTSGLAAALVLGAIIVGLPVMLATVVGWPLPDTMPAIADVQWRLTNGQVPDAFWIGTCACVLWVAWAQLAVGTVAELLAAARGQTIRLPRGFGWARHTVARLVATATMLTALAPSPAYATATLGSLTSLTHTAAVASSTTDSVLKVSPPVLVEGVNQQGRAVERLDTLWGIAETVLGDGNRWPEIRDRNIGRTMPDGTILSAGFTTIRPGWILDIGTNPPVPPGTGVDSSLHTVQVGESFWEIAETTLTEHLGQVPDGESTRGYWRQLVDANTERLSSPGDADLIHPGEQYVLPELPDTAVSTRQLTGPPAVAPLNGTAPRPAPPTSITPRFTTPAAATTVPAPAVTATPPVATAPSDAATPTVVAPPNTMALQGSSAAATGVEEDRTLLAALTGCGILAGGLALRLRALRRRQLRRRHPHTTHPPVSNDASEANDIVRSIAKTDATEWLDATLRYLAAQLAGTANPPTVLLAQAGEHGVELILEEPANPPVGFHADPTLRAWHLAPNLNLADLHRDAGDANPYAPALATIGTTGDAELLINLEAVDVMAIHGIEADTEAFLRGVALAATNAPWSRHIDIITIGIDNPPPHTHTPADPDAWATTAIAYAERTHQRLDEAPFANRLRPDTDPTYPTIILIGPSHDDVAHRLADAASLARSPLTVIAAVDLLAAYTLRIGADHAVLEPLAISLTPLRVSAAHIDAVAELIDDATAEAGPTFGDVAASIDEPDLLEGDAAGTPPSKLAEGVISLPPIGAIDIRILGRTPTIIGIDSTPGGKQLAVATYLAFHRNVPSERVRMTFWPDKTKRTFTNSMTLVRKMLGLTLDGEPRLSDATNTHLYTLTDDVTLDWHRVRNQIAQASRLAETDAMTMLEAALSDVAGLPLADAPSEHYHWILDDPIEYTLIETTLLDAVERLGTLALQRCHFDLARWAVDKGHLVSPGQESLYRLRMRIEHQAGNRDGVRTTFRDAVRSVEAIDPDDEVQDETRQLYRAITRHEGPRRVDGGPLKLGGASASTELDDSINSPADRR